jgi:hypothetical protein
MAEDVRSSLHNIPAFLAVPGFVTCGECLGYKYIMDSVFAMVTERQAYSRGPGSVQVDLPV